MTDDTQNAPPTASLKLTPDAIQAIRDAWRVAGGVSYSAPSGQMCAMAEPKLLVFLSEFMPGPARGTSAAKKASAK